MLETTITKTAVNELVNPTFLVTKQLLSVITLKKDELGLLKVAHLEINQNKNKASVYFEVEGSSFFIEVLLDIDDTIEVTFIDTCPLIGLSLSFTSEKTSLDKLLKTTTLLPSEKNKIGDECSYSKGKISYNNISFESGLKPAPFQSKLNTFLDFLEKDVKGIQELIKTTGDNDIFVHYVYYRSNGNLTQLYLTPQNMSRLNKLGLGLTFDLYSEGKEIR
jgi:hypothetical protein